MKSKKQLFYYFIGCLIVVGFVIYLVDLYWSHGQLELVSYEDGVAELKWHGVDGTELRLYGVRVENVGSLGTLHSTRSDLGSQVLNDGEIFTVGVPNVCVEIHYHHTKVTVRSGGTFQEEFVFLLPPNI